MQSKGIVIEMAWTFSGDKPIFAQLVERITLDILTHRYSPGDRLPAVRDLAMDAGVNPNTVQRALSETEQTGLIVTKRGDGRFVTDDESAIDAVRERYVNARTDEFIFALRSFGLTESEIIEKLSGALSKERNEDKDE